MFALNNRFIYIPIGSHMQASPSNENGKGYMAKRKFRVTSHLIFFLSSFRSFPHCSRSPELITIQSKLVNNRRKGKLGPKISMPLNAVSQRLKYGFQCFETHLNAFEDGLFCLDISSSSLKIIESKFMIIFPSNWI